MGYETDWKPTKAESPEYRHKECGSDDVWYRVWDSSCGGYTDIRYHCRGCGKQWWVEGPDT